LGIQLIAVSHHCEIFKNAPLAADTWRKRFIGVTVEVILASFDRLSRAAIGGTRRNRQVRGPEGGESVRMSSLS
jgi:hypothetical protein